MNISTHSHCESALTGSTLANMIKRCKDLKRTHFSYTDHGHLSSALKAYTMAKKAGLKSALGLEFYFKDSKCPITSGTPAERSNYFTATVFAKNQAAYQELCKVASRTDFPKVTIQDEEQSLWDWETLQNLSKHDTLLVVGGPHCMVGKTLLASDKNTAERIFLKLKDIFQDHLFTSLVCEKWAKKYASVIKIDYKDGTYNSLLATDFVTTDKARKIKAVDLITRSGHNEIQSIISNQTYFKVYKKIDKVTEHKGYLPLQLDITLEINKFLLEMSKKHSIITLLSDYAYYAEAGDRIVQEMVLEGKSKLHPTLNMKSEEDFLNYLQNTLKLSKEESDQLVQNNDKWAKNFDNFELKYEWRLSDTGEKPALQQCMDIINKNGRMKWDDPVYVARLREEIQVIAKNGKKDLSGYFLPIVEVVNHYRKNEWLTSIGRGSCGASLFCYLLEITHIDPIEWDLPFSRFFSMDRILNNKLPDIDLDLPSKELLINSDGKGGFLYDRWGDKACQVSSRSKVRLKSAIKDTNRHFNNGSVEKSIDELTKSLPQPPQNVDDQDFVFGYINDEEAHVPGLLEVSEQLKQYAESRPKEFEVVRKAMGITRAFSVHPCATLISDIPIKDILPTKRGTICQYEYREAETGGLIKYDFLTVSHLLDIQECIKLINKKNGDAIDPMYFSHNGEKVFVWKLPQIPEVYRDVWEGSTKTLFQIHTPGMTKFTVELKPEKMEDISSILAFQRPGPLDFILPCGRNMAEEYIYCRNGKSKCEIPELEKLLPDTYGIICYQEDLNKIARNIAGMDGATAEKLRENMAKKYMKELEKMKPTFIEGASKNVSKETAETIWNQMVTFGRYGFSIIHSLEYSYYTYATMFLRYFYPLEWYASILTNASEKEISGKLWDIVKGYLAPPDINLSTDKMEIDYGNGKIRAKLGIVRGMGLKSIEPIVEGRPYQHIQDFVDREVAGPGLTRKLIHVGVLDSLFPPKLTFLEKLQRFEDAVELKVFKKAKSEGKLIKQKEPKPGKIPEEYLEIEKDPMKNAAVQKSVLPSLLVGLYDLGRNHSKCIRGRDKPSRMMTPPVGDEVLLVTGEMLQRLNDMPGSAVASDKYVAATGYVVDMKIQDYKNNTKQMLKLVVDFDGFVREFICWPDYFTNKLEYPPELKKGQICTIFFKKRREKDGDVSIQEIVIEA